MPSRSTQRVGGECGAAKVRSDQPYGVADGPYLVRLPLSPRVAFDRSTGGTACPAASVTRCEWQRRSPVGAFDNRRPVPADLLDVAARKRAACLTAVCSSGPTTISQPLPSVSFTSPRCTPSARTQEPRTGCDHSCAHAAAASKTAQKAIANGFMRWSIRHPRAHDLNLFVTPTRIRPAPHEDRRRQGHRLLARGETSSRSSCTTEDGVYGVGDATLNGRELAVASYLRDHVVPLLIGRDARRIEDIWQYLYKGAYWRRGPVTMTAIAAVDTALWDIKGKMSNAPVYQLLGGASRDSVIVDGLRQWPDHRRNVRGGQAVCIARL